MGSPLKKTRATKLPSRLRALFWDYKFEDMAWESDQDLIVDRVLTTGDWESVKWLRSRLGDDGLKEWITSHHRKLSPRQLRFWELILKLPHRKVDEWVAAAKTSVWENRNDPRIWENRLQTRLDKATVKGQRRKAR